MADLKTNYKDDVLNTSVNEKRKFNMIQNSDGTVSFEDVTEYTQTGDSFGAADINATNAAVNEANSNLNNIISYSSEEKEVGTFIDGKTIYKKSYYLTGTFTSTAIIDQNFTNNIVDNIVKIDGCTFNSDNNSGCQLNDYWSQSSYTAIALTDTNFRLIIVGRKITKIFVTIYYTKSSTQ